LTSSIFGGGDDNVTTRHKTHLRDMAEEAAGFGAGGV